MVDELSKITNIDESILLNEYRAVHQEKHNVEHPYATLLLPSVKKAFPQYSEDQLRNGPLKEVFHRFNSERKKRLILYPGVERMLEQLTEAKIKVVGFTDSFEENGYYRLRKLDVEKFFTKVYVYDRQYKPTNEYDTPKKVIHIAQKKPDPNVLLEICNNESIPLVDAIYMGDSMTKDIYMSYCAGIESIWVQKAVDSELYKKLVKISHWTKEDFENDKSIKFEINKLHITPTYTISDLDEVTNIIYRN